MDPKPPKKDDPKADPKKAKETKEKKRVEAESAKLVSKMKQSNESLTTKVIAEAEKVYHQDGVTNTNVLQARVDSCLKLMAELKNITGHNQLYEKGTQVCQLAKIDLDEQKVKLMKGVSDALSKSKADPKTAEASKALEKKLKDQLGIKDGAYSTLNLALVLFLTWTLK